MSTKLYGAKPLAPSNSRTGGNNSPNEYPDNNSLSPRPRTRRQAPVEPEHHDGTKSLDASPERMHQVSGIHAELAAIRERRSRLQAITNSYKLPDLQPEQKISGNYKIPSAKNKILIPVAKTPKAPIRSTYGTVLPDIQRRKSNDLGRGKIMHVNSARKTLLYGRNELIPDTSSTNKRPATAPLRYNASEDEPLKELTSQRVTALVSGISSWDVKIQQSSAKEIRRYLSLEQNSPIAEFVSAGVLPPLVKCLTQLDNPTLQLDACWAITNIASGDVHQTRAVIDAGAITPLIMLLHSPNVDTKEQAIWALGNIIGDGPECRDAVVSKGVLKPVIQCMKGHDTRPQMLKNLIWLIGNLFRGSHITKLIEDHIKKILNELKVLIKSPSDEIQAEVLATLWYIGNSSEEGLQEIVNFGFIEDFVDVLKWNRQTAQGIALKNMITIVGGDDQMTEAAIQAKVLPILRDLISIEKPDLDKKNIDLLKNSLWILSNIAAGTESQIQAICDADVLKMVAKQLELGSMGIKIEAAWVLSSLTEGGSEQQVDWALKEGILRPVCHHINSHDERLLPVLLNTLDNITETASLEAVLPAMEEYNVMKFLQNLAGKHDKSDESSEFARNIIIKVTRKKIVETAPQKATEKPQTEPAARMPEPSSQTSKMCHPSAAVTRPGVQSSPSPSTRIGAASRTKSPSIGPAKGVPVPIKASTPKHQADRLQSLTCSVPASSSNPARPGPGSLHPSPALRSIQPQAFRIPFHNLPTQYHTWQAWLVEPPIHKCGRQRHTCGL